MFEVASTQKSNQFNPVLIWAEPRKKPEMLISGDERLQKILLDEQSEASLVQFGLSL